jgi:thiamine biosynthesis lipoprotein ApbE
MDADGMATAFCVLGPERGRAFIEKHPGTSLLVR